MKKNIPELCKTCIHKDDKSLYCDGYALRVATNNLKKCVTDITDAYTNSKTEYDYECDGYCEKPDFVKGCEEVNVTDRLHPIRHKYYLEGTEEEIE